MMGPHVASPNDKLRDALRISGHVINQWVLLVLSCSFYRHIGFKLQSNKIHEIRLYARAFLQKEIQLWPQL